MEEATMELESNALARSGEEQLPDTQQWHDGIGIFQLLGLGIVVFSLLMVLFALVLAALS
jgi:hypothetical protein